jgi:hypothetical protein
MDEPLSDRLAAALSKLAAGDGEAFTALVTGPESVLVLEQDVKSDFHAFLGSLKAEKQNLLLALYLITLSAKDPGPALEAMRLVLSKTAGLALATCPVIFDVLPAYVMFFILLDSYGAS